MAKSEKSQKSYSDLGSGTYYIPEVGTVLNGKVLDGDDPKQVEAYHAHDDKSREQSVEALDARSAEIVEVVAPEPESDKE